MAGEIYNLHDFGDEIEDDALGAMMDRRRQEVSGGMSGNRPAQESAIPAVIRGVSWENGAGAANRLTGAASVAVMSAIAGQSAERPQMPFSTDQARARF